MLSTAVVYLLDKTGKHECRTLLDQSSQVNVIKTSLANRLHFSNLSCRTLILDVRAAHYAHTQLPTLRIRDSCSTAYHFSRFSILYPARRESHKWPIMGYHVHYGEGVTHSYKVTAGADSRWTNNDEPTHRQLASLQRNYQRATQLAIISILGVGGCILQEDSSSSMWGSVL